MSLLLSHSTLSSLNSGPTPILCTPLASLFPIRDLQSSKGASQKINQFNLVSHEFDACSKCRHIPLRN